MVNMMTELVTGDGGLGYNITKSQLPVFCEESKKTFFWAVDIYISNKNKFKKHQKPENKPRKKLSVILSGFMFCSASVLPF